MTTTLIKENYEPIKGKIAVFIMSFNGDTPCLKQCLRGIEQQIKKGYNMEVYICDDANNPITDQDIIQNYNYNKTYFQRNGNLNGTECSLGMLIEMLKVARMSKAQYIMKVDSDMFIRSLERFMKPLEENEKSVVGFRLTTCMNYAAGVTYILPTEGLFNTIKNFYKWYREEKDNDDRWIEHCPEDWAITRSVAAINNYPLIQWDNATIPDYWLMSPFNYEEVNEDGQMSPLTLSRFQLYDFVNFGNRYELTVDNPREFAGAVMKKFVDFDLNNEF